MGILAALIIYLVHMCCCLWFLEGSAKNMHVIYFVFCKVCGIYLNWFDTIREGNLMTVCVARAHMCTCVCVHSINCE